MPLFQDCVAKVKVGKVFCNGQTFKPLFPKQLKFIPQNDIVKLSKECFSSIESSQASRAIANTKMSLNKCKYKFPLLPETVKAKDVVMWS